MVVVPVDLCVLGRHGGILVTANQDSSGMLKAKMMQRERTWCHGDGLVDYVPFRFLWTTRHFGSCGLRAISVLVDYAPFQFVWTTCHFGSGGLPAISILVDYVPFRFLWTTCHLGSQTLEVRRVTEAF